MHLWTEVLVFPAEVNLHDLVQTRYGSRIQVYSTSSADWLMLCPQHRLSSPFPVFSAAALTLCHLAKGREGPRIIWRQRTRRLSWPNYFFFLFLLQQLLSFSEFITYDIAVWLLNISMIFWLLKESRKLLWGKVFIVVYLVEFVSY